MIDIGRRGHLGTFSASLATMDGPAPVVDGARKEHVSGPFGRAGTWSSVHVSAPYNDPFPHNNALLMPSIFGGEKGGGLSIQGPQLCNILF